MKAFTYRRLYVLPADTRGFWTVHADTNKRSRWFPTYRAAARAAIRLMTLTPAPRARQVSR